MKRMAFMCFAMAACLAFGGIPLLAQSPATPKDSSKTPTGEHPLDPVLAMAEEGVARIRKEINDYTCMIIRRERIKGKLGETYYMDAAIRNRKVAGGKTVVPFSVHLTFAKPASVKGRDVIWVEGKNEGKMYVSEPVGLGMKFPIWLAPDGKMAMAECKYPIMNIGMENLLSKLIERGGKDRDRDRPDECAVSFKKGAKVDGRPCTLVTIKHTVQRPEYDYQRAEIFIDDELQLPIRYAAYGYPTKSGEDPIEEEYTYTGLKLNVGLTEKDFEP